MCTAVTARETYEACNHTDIAGTDRFNPWKMTDTLLHLDAMGARNTTLNALRGLLRDPTLTMEQRSYVEQQLEAFEKEASGLNQRTWDASDAEQYFDVACVTRDQLEEFAEVCVRGFIQDAHALVAEVREQLDAMGGIGDGTSALEVPEGVYESNRTERSGYGVLEGDASTARMDPEATASHLGGGASAAEEEGGIPSWMENPSEALAMWRQDPEGFMEAYRQLDDDMKQMVLFGLQQETQVNSQITQMLTNLFSSEHNTSSSVIRNLKV